MTVTEDVLPSPYERETMATAPQQQATPVDALMAFDRFVAARMNHALAQFEAHVSEMRVGFVIVRTETLNLLFAEYERITRETGGWVVMRMLAERLLAGL